MSKTLRWKRGVWWKLVKQVYLVNHESGENWNFCGQHLCIHGHRTRLRCVGGVQEKNTAHPICHTKVTSCWNFSWHTLWSVRLCNRNSKSAKSSFRSKKRKIKICSIKHGSFRQVWCECNSEYLPSEMQKKEYTVVYPQEIKSSSM